MSGHTPGPWRVDDDGAIRARDGCDVVAAFDHRVIMSDADARLIAAAPDLLHVAMMVLRGASDGALYGFARAAVDKATGEASRDP